MPIPMKIDKIAALVNEKKIPASNVAAPIRSNVFRNFESHPF